MKCVTKQNVLGKSRQMAGKMTGKIKLLSLTMLLSFLLVFCCGCSDALTGYWNLAREVSSLDGVTSEATVTIKVNDDILSDESLLSALSEYGITGDMLQNIVINCSTQQNNKLLQASIEAEVILKGKMVQTTLPLHMYIDGVKVYISVDDVLAILDLVVDDEYLEAYKKFFGSAKWVDVMAFDDEAVSMYADIMDDAYMDTILKEYDLLIDLFGKAYSGFNSDILTRSGNTYTFHLDNDNLAVFVKDFVDYSVENLGTILAACKNYIENSVIIDAETKQALLESWDRDIAGLETEVAAMQKEDLADITEACVDTVKALPVDFDVKYTIDRVKKGLYNENTAIDVTYDAYGHKGSINITSSSTTKSDSKVNVAIPADGLAKISDLIAVGRADSDITRANATIYLDDDFMYYSKGYQVAFLDESNYAATEYRLINNYTYLPLRQVGESLGEEVGWSSEKKQAFVVRDGSNIYIDGFSDASVGRTYIKIRDFEKLGFTVEYTKDWPESLGIVRISK